VGVRIVKRFRIGLVFKDHRLLYRSTLGSKVMRDKRRLQDQQEHVIRPPAVFWGACGRAGWGTRRERRAASSRSLLAQCVGQHILLDVQGAVLALVVRQKNTNFTRHLTFAHSILVSFDCIFILFHRKANKKSRCIHIHIHIKETFNHSKLCDMADG
jgi:hypothetical protein